MLFLNEVFLKACPYETLMHEAEESGWAQSKGVSEPAPLKNTAIQDYDLQAAHYRTQRKPWVIRIRIDCFLFEYGDVP